MFGTTTLRNFEFRTQYSYEYEKMPMPVKIDKRSPEYNDAKNTAKASDLLKGIMRRMKQEQLLGGV